MVRFLSGIACLALSFATTGVAATVEPAGDRIAEEIRRLGDDRYATREDATRRLWEIGRAAVPKLREAAEGADPEVAKRARLLIRKIELELTPDTQPEVLALVERYGAAMADEKIHLLQELQQHSAWKQMLRLYRDEKDARVRENMGGIVHSLAIEAARIKLVADKPAEARELLELAPAEGASLMALAEFHRVRGSLPAELAKATGSAWKVALLRASGDVAGARAEAVAGGDHRTAALLALLEGDPVPWLDVFEAAEGSQGPVRLYLRVARKRLAGETVTPADLEPLVALLRSDDDTVRANGRSLLFLLGQPAAAEASLIEDEPLLAFHHFDQLERVADALRVIGLDPAKPDYAGWIAKRFEAWVRDPDEAETERDELLAMAHFLDRRGLAGEFGAYAAGSAKLMETAPAIFIEWFASMFDTGPNGQPAVALGSSLARQYAQDDELKWSEVLDAVLGEQEVVNSWWAWLGELDPRLNRADRFEGMLALFRMGEDPRQTRAAWVKKAWASLDKVSVAHAQPKLRLLMQMALRSGDLECVLRAWERLGENEEEGDDLAQNRGYPAYLAAAGKWDRAAKIWLALVKQNPERPEFHAQAAVSLRRAGRLKEAAEHDVWVDKLALGEMNTQLAIGEAYAFGGDFVRAAGWWQRALREASTDAGNWERVLGQYLESCLETGAWKQAAAVAEMIASISSATDDQSLSPEILLRQRVNADFPRALSMLALDRERSLRVLEECHRLLPADGSLADYFFPALRAAGLKQEHDAWFERTWAMLQPVLAAYPDGSNSLNTAAWLAGRAVRHLDEAEALIQRALARQPEQAAYLDTCGEVWFARGNRKKAMEWSARAISAAPADADLRRQQERFRSAPLP